MEKTSSFFHTNWFLLYKKAQTENARWLSPDEFDQIKWLPADLELIVAIR